MSHTRPEIYVDFKDKCYCSRFEKPAKPHFLIWQELLSRPHEPHSLTWPELLDHYRTLHEGLIPWNVAVYETERLHGDMLRSIPD